MGAPTDGGSGAAHGHTVCVTTVPDALKGGTAATRKAHPPSRTSLLRRRVNSPCHLSAIVARINGLLTVYRSSSRQIRAGDGSASVAGGFGLSDYFPQ